MRRGCAPSRLIPSAVNKIERLFSLCAGKAELATAGCKLDRAWIANEGGKAFFEDIARKEGHAFALFQLSELLRRHHLDGALEVFADLGKEREGITRIYSKAPAPTIQRIVVVRQ